MIKKSQDHFKLMIDNLNYIRSLNLKKKRNKVGLGYDNKPGAAKKDSLSIQISSSVHPLILLP